MFAGLLEIIELFDPSLLLKFHFSLFDQALIYGQPTILNILQKLKVPLRIKQDVSLRGLIGLKFTFEILRLFKDGIKVLALIKL